MSLKVIQSRAGTRKGNKREGGEAELLLGNEKHTHARNKIQQKQRGPQHRTRKTRGTRKAKASNWATLLEEKVDHEEATAKAEHNDTHQGARRTQPPHQKTQARGQRNATATHTHTHGGQSQSECPRTPSPLTRTPSPTTQKDQVGGNAGQGQGGGRPQSTASVPRGASPPATNPQAENPHGIRGRHHEGCGGKPGSRRGRGNTLTQKAKREWRKGDEKTPFQHFWTFTAQKCSNFQHSEPSSAQKCCKSQHF